MTAIGKLLVLVLLALSLGILTWSVGLYAQRPGWFDPAVEGPDKGAKPVTFAQMKTEIDAAGRAAQASSELWGRNLQVLQATEAAREQRKAGYAARLRWAHKGNPADKGNGFYDPVIGRNGLYDLTKAGAPVLGTDGKPLPGLDGQLASIAGNVADIERLSAEITAQRQKFAEVSRDVLATEARALKMNEIRDSVQDELFYLATFEVNVFEARKTVFRRDRQLRDRLRAFGIDNP